MGERDGVRGVSGTLLLLREGLEEEVASPLLSFLFPFFSLELSREGGRGQMERGRGRRDGGRGGRTLT